jgi:two-component system chemotaxis response regulator CheY
MSTAAPISPLANRHFLVVDDEEFVRKLVARFLTQAGAASVVQAADGAEAIDAIRTYEMAFDAVVTDIKMQPLNGLELLRAIRTGSKGLKRNAHVLVLTAHAESELVATALALDADAFVVKPVGREALIERMARILENTMPIQPASVYGIPLQDDSTPPSSGAADPAAPTLSEVHAQDDARYAAVLSDEAALTARRVNLTDVRPNSILAQHLHFGSPPTLLLAAPMILTQHVLDRLKDLQQLHESFETVFVVEPIS